MGGSEPFQSLHRHERLRRKSFTHTHLLVFSINILRRSVCASASLVVRCLIYLNSFLTGTKRIPRNLSGSNGIGALIMLIGVSGGGFSYFVSVLLNFNLLSNTVPSSG